MSEPGKLNGTVVSAAVIAVVAAVAWANIKHAAPARVGTTGSTPDYIHRGALGAYNAVTKPGDLLPQLSPPCGGTVVDRINQVWLATNGNGTVLCNDTTYKSGSGTYAGGTETYLIYYTSHNGTTADGYAIYFPAAGSKPEDLIYEAIP